MPKFSRASPSPRYRELSALYVRMHAEGEARLGLGAQQTFAGDSLFAHVARIGQLIAETGARTVLDYGSGKGLQYRPQKLVMDGRHMADGIAELWGVDEVRCYDPNYPPLSELPQGKFDGVISTDVLEHCPEEDLAWILDEIFGYARAFVYLNVACFPAKKTLPNGENAHATVKPPDWWLPLVASRAQAVPRCELHAASLSGTGVAESVFRIR